MNAPLTADGLDVLRGAAAKLRAEFKKVAGCASYLWPGPSAGAASMVCRGFSYTIPKEEQIRSLLYSVLRDDEPNGAVELEWNVYRATTGPRSRVAAAAEIDLVRFRSSKAMDLLEVKRVWSIRGWNNKKEELLGGIETDRAKLDYASQAVKASGIGCGIVGIVVASFSDSATGHTPMRPSWHAIELDTPSGLPDFEAPDESLHLHARLYFVPAIPPVRA